MAGMTGGVLSRVCRQGPIITVEDESSETCWSEGFGRLNAGTKLVVC